MKQHGLLFIVALATVSIYADGQDASSSLSALQEQVEDGATTLQKLEVTESGQPSTTLEQAQDILAHGLNELKDIDPQKLPAQAGAALATLWSKNRDAIIGTSATYALSWNQSRPIRTAKVVFVIACIALGRYISDDGKKEFVAMAEFVEKLRERFNKKDN